MPILAYKQSPDNPEIAAILCCDIPAFACRCHIERLAQHSIDAVTTLAALRVAEQRRAFALYSDDDLFDTLTGRIRQLRARLQILSDIADSQAHGASSLPCESPPLSPACSIIAQTSSYTTGEAGQ